MSAVAAVRGPAVPIPMGIPGAGMPAGGALLPPAEPPALGALQGAMADLYVIMSQLRDAQVATSKTQADATKRATEIAERERDAAMERARRAAEKGGLFDWIAKDIGLAGVAGLVTFNYALVAADVAVHKLDLVDNLKVDVVDAGAVLTGRWDVLAADVLLRKTELAPKQARELLERLGIPRDAPGISDEDVQPVAKKVLMANLMVLSVAATVLTAGSTTALCIALAGVAISMAGSAVAKDGTLDGVFGKGSSQWIGLGMQIYGAAATGMSGLAATGAQVSAAAKAGAAVAKGTETVARASDQVVTTVHEKQRDDANTSVEAMRLKLLRLDRLMDFFIENIKEVSESSRKASEAIQGAIAAADQIHVALAAGTKA